MTVLDFDHKHLKRNIAVDFPPSFHPQLEKCLYSDSLVLANGSETFPLLLRERGVAGWKNVHVLSIIFLAGFKEHNFHS